jgi:hypothetical protein
VALMTLSVAATWGDGAQQLDLNRRVLRSRPLAPVIEEIRQVTGPLWASRGAWDSALAAVDQYAAASPGFPSSQSAYALATAGVRLGGVPIGEAARRRPGNGLVGNGRLVAWLDGYRAWLAKDPFTLAEARERLATLPWPEGATSLRAYEAELAGRTREAADSLLAVEEALGNALAPRGLATLDAATWLLAVGDTARAVDLIRWPMAMSGSLSTRLAAAVIGPHAILELARVARARGQDDLARMHYRQLLAGYDLAPSAHHSWIEEARTAIGR